MLIQTDNATDTVDLSIEILLPTATSMNFRNSRAESMRFVASFQIELIVLSVCTRCAVIIRDH